MEHTKGKWGINTFPIITNFESVGDSQEIRLEYKECHVLPKKAYYRALDCVNACDGMENPSEVIEELKSRTFGGMTQRCIKYFDDEVKLKQEIAMLKMTIEALPSLPTDTLTLAINALNDSNEVIQTTMGLIVSDVDLDDFQSQIDSNTEIINQLTTQLQNINPIK